MRQLIESRRSWREREREKARDRPRRAIGRARRRGDGGKWKYTGQQRAERDSGRGLCLRESKNALQRKFGRNFCRQFREIRENAGIPVFCRIPEMPELMLLEASADDTDMRNYRFSARDEMPETLPDKISC